MTAARTAATARPSDHKADAEALTRVQNYLGCFSDVAESDANEVLDEMGWAAAGYPLTLADLRRVVNMAEQIGDAR